jgi:hypothetical protein
MRAIVFDRYGEPDVMSSREVPIGISFSTLSALGPAGCIRFRVVFLWLHSRFVKGLDEVLHQ